MNLRTKKISRKIAGSLLASTIAVSAFALSPVNGNMLALPYANAEAVRVDAPKAPGFADVVQAVSPAVVSVRVEQVIEPASNDGYDGEYRFDRRYGGRGDNMPEFFRNNPDLFKRFFGNPRDGRPHDRRRFGASQGSGFFISEDGFLVTNNHVIDGGTKYTVVMDDGTEFEAKLVGADKRSDLAVLKIDADREFTYVEFSDDAPRIGDWVVAVGNPFGLGGTVTAGIVSAHNREIGSSRYDDFIQIDAAVNKGNSGGPAFDLNGGVIGVNTAIFSPSGGNVGIAFAIPAATAKEIVGELIENGTVVRGWLGVQIQPVTSDIAEALALDEASGAMVTEPQTDSPADKAGIRSGDVITEVNGRSVRGPKALARLIGEFDPDSKVSLTIMRNGKEMEVGVTLGSLNDTLAAGLNEPEKPEEGKLGLALSMSPDGDGVLITEVQPGSPADMKGLRPGDVVTSVNGEKVVNPGDVGELVDEVRKAGRKSALFQLKRNGSSSFIAVPFERS